MPVEYSRLKDLECPELERLISWETQRQLRWAVFLVTSLVALLQLFLHTSSKYYSLSIHTVPSKLANEPFGLLFTLMLVVIVTLCLLVCERRTINYYYHVAEIQEIWIKKKEKIKDLKRENAFSVGKWLDHFVMRCPTNAKNFSTFVTLVMVIILFILPVLL